MNRSLLFGVAALVVLILPLPALACTPVPAKTWSGAIQFATPGGGVSKADYELPNTKCQFSDPQLNGFDARVFDVSSHRGLKGELSWTTTAPVAPDRVNAIQYDSSCVLAGSQLAQANDPGQGAAFDIHADAKWLLVYPSTNTPSKDISVKVTSAGRKCPTT